MRTFSFLTALILVSVATPANAQSYVNPDSIEYLTPEQFIFDYEYTFPPNSRQAHELVNQRQQERAKQLLEAQQSLRKIEDRDNDFPVAQDTQATEGPTLEIDGDTLKFLLEFTNELRGSAPASSDVSSREQRLLDRIAARQEAAALEQIRAQYQASTGNETLHSGAPLVADTGPGTILAVLAVLGSLIWTLHRARRLEKKA